jgi:hypothetical protein
MRKAKQEANHGVRPSAALTGGWWRRIGLVGLVLAAAMTSPASGRAAFT